MRRSAFSIMTLGAFAAAAAAGALVAAVWWGDPAPASTRIALIGCGISPGPPEMDLPLGLILERAAPASVSLGPFDLTGIAGPVTIRFEAASSIGDKAPWRKDGVVKLPVLVASETPLEQVTLRCRHGRPARVGFQYGTEIMDLEIAPTAPEAPTAPGPVSARRG